MYEFERADADGAAVTRRLPKPPVLLTALEAMRLTVEHSSSMLLDLITPDRPDGAGRPVLVIPGFYAGDSFTCRVRTHLRKHGYHVHGWRLGRNYGLTDELVAGVIDRLDDIHDRHQSSVSVVGWSFGGLVARWLAHERPEKLRQVVCMGSPWRPEGEVTRTTPMFQRAADKHGLSDRARDIVATLRRPLPVRCTAIYSKSDGILNWRSCALDEGENCENIPVPSSHVGLVSNPLALAVLVDRLAQDPANPKPFDWRSCLRRAALGAPDTNADAAPPRTA
jgi:pimeloyl-ACP methyl ester carboxylesterase